LIIFEFKFRLPLTFSRPKTDLNTQRTKTIKVRKNENFGIFGFGQKLKRSLNLFQLGADTKMYFMTRAMRHHGIQQKGIRH
jgi:hypothetical protein